MKLLSKCLFLPIFLYSRAQSANWCSKLCPTFTYTCSSEKFIFMRTLNLKKLFFLVVFFALEMEQAVTFPYFG